MAELLEGRGGVDLGRDAVALGEEVARRQHLLQDRARSNQPDAALGVRDLRRPGETVEAPDDPLVNALGLRRLRVVLVVDVDVVEDVLAVAEHAPDAVPDDGRQLVGIGRVVGTHHGDRGREHLRMAVVVLEALARERRPAGRGPDHEAAAPLVPEGPDLIAGPLEPEHRVEDVEGDHRLAVRGIRRAGGLQRGHRARLVDPLLQHLAVPGLAVGQHEVRVHRLVACPWAA